MATNQITRGRTFVRYAKSLAIGGGDPMAAAAFAGAQRWEDGPQVIAALKASVDFLTGDDLAFATRPVSLDFALFLRPRTVIGRLAGLRTVVAGVRTVAGGGARGYFIGEGDPIPVSEGQFALGDILKPAKAGAVVAASSELVRSASPDAEVVLADDLAAGVAEAIDVALLDPLNDGTASDAPESLTHGTVAIASTGSSLAAIDADLRALLNTFDDAGIELTFPAFVMPRKTLLFMASLRGSGGALAWPTLSEAQPLLYGIPVLTSKAARSAGSPGGQLIALIEASEVLLADEGRAEISVTRVGSLQMTDSPSVSAAPMVSLWQNNLIGFRALRWIKWQRRRVGAVAHIANVAF